MPKITVLPHPELAPDGAVFDAPEKMSICDALLLNKIDMEHACGQVGACSTCHVVVLQGFESLNELGDNEEDMLDQVWGLQPHSRLSCQARLAQEDLTVELPRYTLNHARE
ncbi:ISC system 2Fe-2S type ferredoxin [Janthinobacterium sp.]|uniref:ISC system 2Fe-2S type ferredoxin n=1 Tax=Janthinobacterium sp. TaxID=1871054 RepID=UPI00261C2833|nr:ISC system 2Fe-2S type ferredoxin [Janthinobacterium sp.]